MGGGVPKVLRLIDGKSVIICTLETLRELGLDKRTILVVGHGADLVKSEVRKNGFEPEFVFQEQQLGTGDAVRLALTKVPDHVNSVLILFGDDSGLYRSQTLKDFVDYYEREGGIGSVIVKEIDSPSDLGALKVNENGEVFSIMLRSELESLGVRKNLVMCGALCFDRRWLDENIQKITPNKNSGEYPLPKLVNIAVSLGTPLKVYKLKNKLEWTSVNSEVELEIADKFRRMRPNV